MRFTEEELAIAKQADLCVVAAALGYTVKRIGKYHTLKEMDSIRIYNRTHWFRWSRQYEQGENGGSQIDFLRVFAGMEVKDAVFWLLDFVGYQKMNMKELKNVHNVELNVDKRKEFILPEYAGSNGYLYHYLEQERGIDSSVIDKFVKAGLLYEAKNYHNIVFVGKDKFGTPRFASMRGVFDKNGKPFKCDVAGNDKRYGFHVLNIESEKLIVFEAAIDLLSYQTLFPKEECSMLALGMLADMPLEQFLKDYAHIKQIQFSLDNDEPGKNATKELIHKYSELGYVVKDLAAPKEYKDYNEWLQTRMKKPVISEKDVKMRK